MVKSVYTAPHVTIMDEADVSTLVELRTKAKPIGEKKGIKITYLPFIVKALVAAVNQFPALNASIDDEKGEIVYKRYTTSASRPIRITDWSFRLSKMRILKSIWQIAAEINDKAVRARRRQACAERDERQHDQHLRISVLRAACSSRRLSTTRKLRSWA